ncbi:DUF1444 family protein [Burkholderia pyrrocinia]|uniref:DUF1444 family protein n=1 Tax=Burkholderia pyrrocinia TaxID=60550 RepID=UPI00158F1660|nr:DUF1444 family protein [Burkholderia pyrrocinia]
MLSAIVSETYSNKWRLIPVSMPTFCSRAIAYLKPTTKDVGPTVSLPRPGSPVLQVINEDLLVAYLVDMGDHFEYVQHWHLEQEGMSADELHGVAVSNLQNLAEERLVVREYGPIHVALMGGNFEASLLLVHSMWSAWYAHLVKNTYMVAAPARDILAFCDASSTDGVAELRQVIQRVQNCDHRLHPHLYRRSGLEWHTIE